VSITFIVNPSDMAGLVTFQVFFEEIICKLCKMAKRERAEMYIAEKILLL